MIHAPLVEFAFSNHDACNICNWVNPHESADAAKVAES
jgi:hypothetical protein